MTASSARSASAPWPISRRPGPRSGRAAGEKARSMRARKHTDLDGDWAHVLQAAAVDADALLDDALPHTVLKGLVEKLAEDVDVLRETLAELDHRLRTKVVQGAL